MFLFLLLLVSSAIGPTSYARSGDPPSRAKAALERLRRERGETVARLDPETGIVRSVRGRFRSVPPARAREAATQFLIEHGDLFGLADPRAELFVRSADQDARGYQSIRFGQRVGTADVLGADLRVDIDPSGVLYAVHGTLVPDLAPPLIRPRVSAARAVAIASHTAGAHKRRTSPASLAIARLNGRDTLVWQVTVHTDQPAHWRLLIDALSGDVLERHDTLAHAKDRRVHDALGGWSLPGKLVRHEHSAEPTSDRDVETIFEFLGRTYDYFYSHYGRDSIDGRGMPLVATTHFGVNYANAFWDSIDQQVVFGDGDDAWFGPLGLALDIVAHEVVHGITEHTAKLDYKDESGALNEAYSDIFGALVEGANWEIAEDIFTPHIPGDALRSLADPSRYGQPSVWGEYLDMPLHIDSGGVHSNSGIFNHIAYLIARQTGPEKLGQIFYRTLTMKLTQRSSFQDAREHTISACIELIGAFDITREDCRQVKIAFAQVGLGDYPPAPENARSRILMPMVLQGQTRCGTNLARNGGFEQGQSGWPNNGNILSIPHVQPPDQASARLKGNEQMLQLLQMPGDARPLEVSFDIFRPKDTVFTRLWVSLQDPNTRKDLAPPIDVGQDLDSGVWQRITIRLDAPTSPTARILFGNVSGSSAVHLDNIAVHAHCD